MTERDAFEAWLITPPMRYPGPPDGWTDLQKEDDWLTWQASRKVACDQVVAHFESYTNETSGRILAKQVKDILK